MPSAGILAGVGGAIGGLGSIIGGGEAASGAQAAANLQAKEFQYTTANLNPFNNLGVVTGPMTANLAMSGPTAGGPDYVSQAAAQAAAAAQIGVGPGGQAALEQTPGYQFQLQQGLKSVQSGAAARGLGVSGASMKGAADYVTGLASSNYQQQFQNALANASQSINLNTAQQGNIQNEYNRLADVTKIGANAAANTGQFGTQAAASAGNFLNAAGQAQAAGTTGVGSAITGGINSYLGFNALQNLINPAAAGSGATGGYRGGDPAGAASF